MTVREGPTTGRELRSLVSEEGTLELRLMDVAIAEPDAGEVLIRVEAAPINPSDVGLLLAGADLSTAQVSGPATDPVMTATVPEATMPSLAARVGKSLAVGNE